MASGVGLQSSLNRVVSMVCVLLATACTVLADAKDATPHHHAQSALPRQPPAQNQQDIIPLEPGKLLEREIAGGQKHSYQFEMAQGQYSSIVVDCGGMRARITLYDTAGTAISDYDTEPNSPKQTVEIVAKATGHYRMDVKSKLPKAPAGTCSVLLAAPRSASENEVLLQEARELDYKAGEFDAARKYDEALEPAQRALELRERLLGPEDALIASPLIVLGNIYNLGQADYQKAEAFYLRALKIQEKTTGSVSDSVFTIANNLGTLYSQTDEFDKAESSLQRAIDVAEKMYGPDNTMEANSLVNLATVCDQKADYSKAERLYERAMAITEREFGPNYLGLATIIANLSGVYSEKGDYLKAESFGRRALTIVERAVGPENGRLGIPLVTLGDAYRFEGQPDKAEPLYERALKIFEKTRGPEHPLVADTLTYLADIYHDRLDFAKAETFHLRALAIREKKLGSDHPDVGLTLDNLATLYRDQGDYARAEPLYQRALANREKALGPEHPDVVSTLTNISTLQMAIGRFSEAQVSLSRAITISERSADLNLLAGSERQKLAYLKLLSSQLDQAITLNVGLAPEQRAARDLALTTVLQRKGRVQDVLSDSLVTLRKHMHAEDAELLVRSNNIASQLSRLVLNGPQHAALEEHQLRVAALKEEREKLETEISRHSAEFRAGSQPVTIEAVRAALPENAVLLEFVDYKKFLPQGITAKNSYGEPRYVVYVVQPRGDVQWKELGDAKALDGAIDKLRQALRDPKRNDINQLARDLDERVLQPLRGLIGDATHLLVSPDGELDLIPFEALVDEQGRYAVERYSISYLTTGRDLLRMQVARESKSAPLVVADPYFGEPGGTLVAFAGRGGGKPATSITARRSITTGEDLSAVYFAPLGGTALEARTIKSLFPEAQVLTGQQATKPALKQVEAPRLLHIATHGFFLLDAADDPKPEASKPGVNGTRAIHTSVNIENPLLRSGLALAGANLNKSGGDDGILTALEASNLNLWGTKLVTLSACDTGVGEVKNGEGVYGLRRAFFLAGTESLVMSLWPVSDYVTRELMTEYYARLKKNLGRGEALRQAQLAMLKRKGRHHPFYWASFIQSGEWANLDGQR
jgi:CHAT domain-containing protein/Tfp pilus assembly protein PilF